MNIEKLVKISVDDILSHFPNESQVFIKNNCFLAGGVFKSLFNKEFPKDWDFYFKSDKAISEFVDLRNRAGFPNSTLSKNAYNVKLYNKKYQVAYDLQFIVKWPGSPEEVISRFDFHNNMNFYDLATGTFSLKNCNLGKNLKFNINCQFPANALIRAVNLAKTENWTMQRDEYINMILAINQLNLNDSQNLYDQLAGPYDKSPKVFENKINTILKEFKKNYVKNYNSNLNTLIKDL